MFQLGPCSRTVEGTQGSLLSGGRLGLEMTNLEVPFRFTMVLCDFLRRGVVVSNGPSTVTHQPGVGGQVEIQVW